MELPETFRSKNKNSCNAKRLLEGPKYKTNEIIESAYHEKIFPKNLVKFGSYWMHETESITTPELEKLVKQIKGYKSLDDHNALNKKWFARLNFNFEEEYVGIYLPWIGPDDSVEVYATGKIRMQEVEDLIEKLHQVIPISE